MGMGVLTRYLIRVHVGPFLFALSTLTALIFLNAVAQRIEGLLGKGLSWRVVVEFLALSLPHTIALSLPMSVLVAVLYAFSEMTSSNEITAMSAGGIRPARLILPLVAMGALMTGVMLYFNDVVLPESNHRLKNLMVDIARKSPTLDLREQIVNEIRTESGLNRYFLTTTSIDPVENTLQEVTIFDGNNPMRRRTTYAAWGEMIFNEEKTDLYLTLYDGVVHEVQNDRVGGFQRLYFEKQIIPLRGVGNELVRRLGGTDRSDREMGFALLAENARAREIELDSVRMESRAATLEAVRLALERYARIVRGLALSASSSGYAVAVGVLGASPARIYLRHILPNMASAIIVNMTLNFPETILVETSLSFLGLGIQPPLTSLGNMVGFGRDYLLTAWWIVLLPAIVIFVTSLAFSLLGDWLRDQLDPTLRGN